MNAPLPNMADAPRAGAPGQRLGQADEITLYDQFLQTGVLRADDNRGAALALIALAIRCRPSLLVARFIDVLPGPDAPLNEVEICNVMARLGFEFAEVIDEPESLDQRLGPALSLDGKPKIFATAKGADGKPELCVFDCVTGATSRLIKNSPLARRRRRMVVFQQSGDTGRLDKPGRDRPDGQSWFAAILARMRGTTLMLMVLGFALTATSMVTPIFIMLIYDQVVGPRSFDPFLSIALGGCVVILAEMQLRFLRARALAWLTARLDYLVGTGLFEKLLTLPPRVAEQVPISAHIARIRTFESVRDFFSGPILVSALGVPATLLSLLVIWLLAGSLVMVTLTTIAAYLLIAPLLWRRVSVAIEAAALEGSAAQRFTLETFQKLPSIRQDGLALKWQEKFRSLSGAATAAQYRLNMLGQTCEAIGSIISGLSIIATLWVGTQMVWDNTLSVGALIALTMLTWNTLFPFHSLMSLLPRFEQSRKSILQINKFMDTDLDEQQAEGDVPAPILKGAVEFAGVAVRYSQAAGPVFAGLSFKVAPGQLVAVAGANGSGKSSVMKLAAGLRAPTLGAVRFDGLDARQLNPRDLRRRIAYVPQRVSLFSGSLAENLRHANRLASEIELWSALDLVGARAQVEALPDGLATEIVPRSAGQNELLVQRIALARAILQNSQLILIDERPASALRAGLDQDLKTMLTRLRKQRTVFIATHRADFLRMADKAIALRSGQMPVVGSPDKIMDVIE